MDENNPSGCHTFLHHEAAYRSRLSADRKKRLSPRSLLSACVKLVNDFNCKALPDVAPEDYAKVVITFLNVWHPHDQTFLTQKIGAESASAKDENKIPYKAKPFRAKPIPNWKQGPTSAQKALVTVYKESREKRAKFYADPKNRPFHLHALERPSKFDAIKEQIEIARKQETKYIAPKARPCPEPNATEVKLTTAAVLREHALYEKQLKEEQQRVEAFEFELRGDAEYKSWKEEMRRRDGLLEDAYRKFRKAAVDASDQAAVQAKNAKVAENRDIVKNVKEESQKCDALKKELFVNLALFNGLRRENIMEGKKATKLAMKKLAESKNGRAREIQAEVTKLVTEYTNEHAAQVAKKKEIVRQLHSHENAESVQMMRKFDPESTAGHGLLAEMTMKELQERLGQVKEAIKEEEVCKRSRIHASKDEQHNKIREKSEFVKRMREVVRADRRMSNRM